MMPRPRPPSEQSSARHGAGNEPVQECSASGEELLLELKTDDGYAIPETAFRLELQNGERRSGRLDRQGRRVLRGLPPGVVFALYYPDSDDIRAKANAARLDAALSAADVNRVCSILTLDRAEVAATARALQTYFARDMNSDCRSVFAQGVDAMAVAHCLHLAGFSGSSLAEVIEPVEARDADR